MNVPMALSVRGRETFSDDRAMGVDAALSIIPGVMVSSRAGAGDVRLTIRGFGARGSGDRSNAATVRGVKVLLDGIPETEPDGRTTFDLIDISSVERVEVFRTNASTLFGNASGGVINFSTVRSFEQPFISGGTLAGEFGLRRLSVEMGTRLSSSSLQASFSKTELDGWRSNSASSQQQATVSLNALLGESTNLRVFTSGATNAFSIPGALTQAQFDADPSQANPAYLARRERRRNLSGRIAFDLTTPLAEGRSLNIVGFVTPKVLQRSERGTFRDFNRYHVGAGSVYRWTPSNRGLLNSLLFGIDGAYQDGSILFYNLVGGERGDSLRTNKREGAATWGAFAKAEVAVVDRILLTGGLRFDHQQYIAEDYAAGVKKTVVREELNLDHFTPSVALLYRPAERVSLYAAMSGGLESPAFNEVDPPPGVVNPLLNQVLKPMTSTTYEFGIKGWLEPGVAALEQLVYSASAFTIHINDEIVPYNGGAYFFSAGVSNRSGLEASLDARFSFGCTWQSALTLLKGTYETYTNDLGNFSGNAAPGIPDMTWNNKFRWESQWGFSASFTVHTTSSYVADDANIFFVPSATVLSAAVCYQLKLGSSVLDITTGVQNLTDTKYAASAFINPSGGAFLEPGLPRNVYGGIQFRIDL